MYNISIVVIKTLNDMIEIGEGKPHPKEVERFHELTRFRTVCMGRRTHEALGTLHNRVNLVLSRRNLRLTEVLEVSSIEDVLNFSKDQEVLVVGGSEVFNQLLPYASKIYLTVINKEVEGNLFLKISEEDWEVSHEEIINDDLVFKTLVRKDKEII